MGREPWCLGYSLLRLFSAHREAGSRRQLSTKVPEAVEVLDRASDGGPPARSKPHLISGRSRTGRLTR